MNGTNTVNRAQSSPAKPGSRRYWGGFSVCLFMLLLAVFTWAVHRRLTQYEAMENGGHHMTATKVCLTERPQISVPTVQSAERGTMFLVAIAFAFASYRLDDLQPLRMRPGYPPQLSRTRIRSCLAHFFFLPPPATSIAL
jgi:hypothetical protein